MLKWQRVPCGLAECCTTVRFHLRTTFSCKPGSADSAEVIFLQLFWNKKSQGINAISFM